MLRSLLLPLLLVAISVESGVQRCWAAEINDEEMRSLIANVQRSVTTIRVQGRDGEELGLGTGFVIDEEGLIATNFHVIDEGRPFSVQTADGEDLQITAVEASDVSTDLAIIRVAKLPENCSALVLASNDAAEQGTRVLAFGNPLGLENSVVEGIVSARREVEGRDMLQLAMPIESGNSGGPLVDLRGRVHGIINMKSAIDQNLGFAIPIEQLVGLRQNPNPVAYERWVQLGGINEDKWMSLFGANWTQRGGRIKAQGLGKGFGGRSLLLANEPVPETPYEVGVTVRLDDEAGAAGLVFHSDDKNRHYGFYPSAGRVRLSCFMGPSVYSWQVLKEVATEHYLPGQWNDLKVRVGKKGIKCYVNGHLVIESTDSQLFGGKVGLAKFRGTKPEFKRFRLGKELGDDVLPGKILELLDRMRVTDFNLDEVGSAELLQLGESGELASRELVRQARQLEDRAERLRNLAGDVLRSKTLRDLQQLTETDDDADLLRGALLIAMIDHPDLDPSVYESRIDSMADEISKRIDGDATTAQRREILDTYLFQENGFHGSRTEYYHPANSHLNRVIDDREGLPITLAVLYMELGKRIGIEIEGVGLPGHFVARHVIDEEHSQLIDVFERGALMSDQDAQALVQMHAGRPLLPQDLLAGTTNSILTRILNNLIGIAGRNEDAEAMLRYSDALVAINFNDPQARLVRAQLRGFTGREPAAIEDLDWLLERDPVGISREAVRRMRAALVQRVTDRE